MNKTQLEMTLSMLEADRKVLKQERDTYRELCGELLDKIAQVKKRLGDGDCDEWTIKALVAIIDLEITKAESILGESNAT